MEKALNNVLSLSGGKDSTAMAILMKERGEPIHSCVFFDTGWEFPQMYPHLDRLEKFLGMKIWRLTSRFPFDYWATARPVIAKDGPNKGKVHRIGNGWPSPSRRWCTARKVDTVDLFCKVIPNAIQCIGYAADEAHRQLSNPQFQYRFPLIEYGITEADALKICYERGFDWGGLYQYFDRVSCFCCPLQGLNELRTLRRFFPDLWQRMLEIDRAIPVNRGFRGYETVQGLEKRFEAEEDDLFVSIEDAWKPVGID